MNPGACRVVLRPRGPGETVDLAVRLAQANARLLLRTSARVLAPCALGVLLSTLHPLGPAVAAGVVLLLVPVLQAPFVAVAAVALFPGVPGVTAGTFRSWLADGAFRVGSALGLLLVDLGTCGLAILPLLVVGQWVGDVRTLEHVGPVRALGRSFELASGEAGTAVGAAVATWSILLAGALGGEALGHLVVSGVLQLGTPFGAAWTGQVTPFVGLGILAVQPLMAWVRVLAYVDARTRREGWDLQVALRVAAEAAC